MRYLTIVLLGLAVSACSNFPCSPQNPCAPGDGGASMRDTARVINEINRPGPVYTPIPAYQAPRQTVCRRNGPTMECWSQ